MLELTSKRIVFPGGEELIEASLLCKNMPQQTGETLITSSRDQTTRYKVSISTQTCTCPDFANRHEQPLNHFSRWCKHLVLELNFRKSFSNECDWFRAIASQGQRGPMGAWLLRCPGIPEVLLTGGDSKEWINVFSRTRRKTDGTYSICGPIQCFGWSIDAHRWSYRSAPPSAPKLRAVLDKIEAIETY